MSDNVSGRKMLDFGARQRSSREITSSSSNMSVYGSSDEDSVRYKGSKESPVYKSSDEFFDMSVYKSSDEGSVRYKGSKISPVNRSSDEFFEYSCDPCSSAGDHLEAEGFCTNCGEHLCGACLRNHLRAKTTKHHKLQNKDNMLRKQVQSCDPCKTVGEELEAIGYCDDCKEYLCSNCFRSHSRSKATKHHKLIDKDNMPQESYRTVASSIAEIDIHKEGAGYQKSKEEYSYIQDISVKAAGDAKDCYIIAMTLTSNHKLVLADYYNVSLKLVDVERNVMKETLNLESKPFGLTTVSKDEVAVLLSNIYVIQIVTVSWTISVQRNIKLMGICADMDYLNGKLYASFLKPINFQILQLSGAVYKTIKPDAEVLEHCAELRNIAVNPNESVIYVSDWETNKVMCIDLDGNMIFIYQHELYGPTDIAVTPCGSVYLCDRDQHAILKMTPDLGEATVILGPENGLIGPQALCLNFARQHLYISSGNSEAINKNNIKVFKWQ